MTSLREQYERETGKKSRSWLESDEAVQYAAWLERRAECAEQHKEQSSILVANGVVKIAEARAIADQLAVALRNLRRWCCRPGDDGKHDDGYDEAREQTKAALAKYEAACNGGGDVD